MEQGKTAQDDYHVMHVGNDGRHGKTPFKTDGQVNDDANTHHGNGRQTVSNQFLTYLRADEVVLQQLHIGIAFFQDVHHFVRQFRRMV